MDLTPEERRYLERTIPGYDDEHLVGILDFARHQRRTDCACRQCQWSSLVVRTIGDEYVKRRLSWPKP